MGHEGWLMEDVLCCITISWVWVRDSGQKMAIHNHAIPNLVPSALVFKLWLFQSASEATFNAMRDLWYPQYPMVLVCQLSKVT
jgi:hypothetical protein